MTDTNNLRILIIDDNPEIHKDFIKILKPKEKTSDLDALDEELFGAEESQHANLLPSFVIEIASQGLEGVDKVIEAKNRNEPYALAFVDIRMPPGLDGVETIRRMWEIDPDVQAVICTAYSDYTWEETVSILGANDNLLILKKPFDAVAVRQLACALTKKWQLLQITAENTRQLEDRVNERTRLLQESLSLTRATLDSSIDGIVAVNNDGKVVDYNNQYLSMWNIPHKLIAKQDYEHCLNHVAEQLAKPEAFLKAAEQLAADPDTASIETIHLKDGRVVERYSHPQKLDGKTVGRIWSFRDISDRVNLEERIQHQATHDHLTDLPNRVQLRDRVQYSMCQANKNNSMVGVLFFDLDRFKLVNDSLGHEAGDKLLQGVADRLRPIIRAKDTVARLGGDEFVVVVGDAKSLNDVEIVADKILEELSRAFHIESKDLHISASIGISMYPDDGITVDELLRNADLAMYMAKKSGANRHHRYTTQLKDAALIRLENEEEMRNALENGEFFLMYQPQLDLETDELVSLEALVRWEHPKKGLMPPVNFIPFAEDSGLIIPLGEWVMKTACKQCKIWQDKGAKDLRIAVNVATGQLKKGGFVNLVQEAITESGIKPECLEIEITENVLFSDQEIMKTINEVKKLGVQIALDDFGAGYSCLSFLKQVDIDRIKIDQSFIQNILINRSDEVIIQAIIEMAKSLDLEVLAEGVETQEQVDFIRLNGCQTVQGYFFGKPMSVEDIDRLVKKMK